MISQESPDDKGIETLFYKSGEIRTQQSIIRIAELIISQAEGELEKEKGYLELVDQQISDMAFLRDIGINPDNFYE